MTRVSPPTSQADQVQGSPTPREDLARPPGRAAGRLPPLARPPRSGFTFTEVMVAVIVMMVGLLPVYTIMQGNSKRAQYNKMRSFAGTLAQNYLERIRACSLDFLDGAAATPTGGPTPSGRTLDDVVPQNSASVPLFQEDQLMNPLVDPSVPSDPEMKSLLAEWDRRRSFFSLQRLPVKKEYAPELYDLRMRVLGVKIFWGKERQTAQPPATLDELTLGTEHLSLVAFAGETLFHPPPKPGGATPP